MSLRWKGGPCVGQRARRVFCPYGMMKWTTRRHALKAGSRKGISRNYGQNNDSPLTARRVLSAFQYSARLVFSSGAKMCVRESRMLPRNSEMAPGDVWCFTSAFCAVGEISESSACLARRFSICSESVSWILAAMSYQSHSMGPCYKSCHGPISKT